MSHRVHRHLFIAATAFGVLIAVATSTLALGQIGTSPGPSASAAASPRVAFDQTALAAAGSFVVPGTMYVASTPAAPVGPTFPPIDVLYTPSPAPLRGALPTDPSQAADPRRPLPVQSIDWLKLKAAGRISFIGGRIDVLPVASDPLVNPSTSLPVSDKQVLDLSWTRWVVEPPGSGSDEMGNSYSNLSYWNLCGDGAMAVSLWYWQQLTGHPNVTDTEGYFLDPYAAEGVAWPAGGPWIPAAGTFWSGSDEVSGFTSHGRGFLMYLATTAQPPTWQSAGLSIYARGGKPLYPTSGTPRTNIQTGLNWEVSGRDGGNWKQAYYASVLRPDPTLARDLTAAVMLDVGRDGVPVVAAVDTYNLPNWQNGSATPHIRHAIAIVGYDNTANPPTFTYLDTCGRSCNNRGGNQNGEIHVIAQSEMVLAIQNQVGSGFVW